MARLVLRIVTGISAALLAFTALLVVASYFFSPWEHYYVSWNQTAHVGVWGRDFDPRLVFFSDPDGPYRANTTRILVDEQGYPYRPRVEGFGDSWGIYFRYFQWPNTELWTLTVSLWYPMAIFAILPAIRWLAGSLRRRNRKADPPERPT
jgi:hypothetical protein